MHKVLVLICILVASLPLAAATVNVRRPNITMSSSGGVRAACNEVVETACTRFDGTVLYCVCAPKGDRWSPRVRIEAQPRVYLSNSMYLLHEIGHVFDFQRAMRFFAAAIESRSFPAQSDCDDFAGETHRGFDHALLDFRRASMLSRDHELSNGK